LDGEVAWDTTNKKLKLGDGSTTGGKSAAYSEDLAASGGSSAIGFLQAGTGAVTRDAQAKMRDGVSIKDFGAIGDGTLHTVAEWIIPGALGRFANLTALQAQYPFVTGTSWSIDRAAIQAAHIASKQVFYPSGTYHMGDFSTVENMVDLSTLGAGIAIQTDKSVELICNTTASVEPVFFYLFANSNFSCGHIRFRDTGYNSAVTWRGATGFKLASNTTAAGTWGDVDFDSIYAKNLVAVIKIEGGDATRRISGIRIGKLYSDDCYYGYNGQNQGDGVQIGLLYAVQNVRPYFVYGVNGHKVNIFARNNRGSSGSINISRAVGGLSTKDIEISYTARDQTQNITHVLINHIDLLGGTISGIKVNLDIESPSSIYTPVRFVNYSGSGGSETSAASSNVVTNIKISGFCDVQALPCAVVGSYATLGKLEFTPSLSLNFDSTIPPKFSLSTLVGFTPSWTASVNPAIGNGTVSASYSIHEGLCYFYAAYEFGSTTTFGSGAWTFSLPFSAKVPAVGSVYALDSGTNWLSGACHVDGSNLQLTFNATVNQAGPLIPITWASGDRLFFSVVFPV
jgi:hypothetical protein